VTTVTASIPSLADDRIVEAAAWLCDIPVEVERTDAMQSFLKQETIFVRIRTASGIEGFGYSYTIGTGGRAVLSLLQHTLLDQILGEDVQRPESVWAKMLNSTRATAVGAITSLAFAAVDTAVWDARTKAVDVPLWKAAGGARSEIDVYDTEGGWLHLTGDQIVEAAVASQARGMRGVKVKVGKPSAHEDFRRLALLREAVGADFDIMIDANQAFTAAEAIRRARLFEPLDIFWFEEPLPADDIAGHASLRAATSIPVAVGESMYSVGQFGAYLRTGAAAIVQPDVARVGGITPWLKIAHLAEAHNVSVAPHFLMELHAPLVCAIPNALYLEHIPQLRALTRTQLRIENGMAIASDVPGLGIDWDFDALDGIRVA